MSPLTALLALAWIVGTLVVVFICLFIARRYGSAALIGLFAALYVISAVLANKLIVFFIWIVPAGTICFSLTFLLTDMLSEFFGKPVARRAVWVGFLAQLLLLGTVWIAIPWPHPEFWQGQAAFEATLGNTWRIVIGSLVAYVIGQNHDVWAYHFWKRVTDDKHLWLRNNLSTIISQTLDSVVFSTIAFYGIAPLLPLIGGTLAAKVVIAVADTPFLYLARAIYNRPGARGDDR